MCGLLARRKEKGAVGYYHNKYSNNNQSFRKVVKKVLCFSCFLVGSGVLIIKIKVGVVWKKNI
jgi:hypothetical protein